MTSEKQKSPNFCFVYPTSEKKGKDMGRIKKDNVPFTRRTRPEFIPIIDAFIKQLELYNGMVSFSPSVHKPVIEPPVDRSNTTPADYVKSFGKSPMIIEEPFKGCITMEDPGINTENEEPTITIDDLPDEIREFLIDGGYYEYLTLQSRKIVDATWFRLLYNQLMGTADEKQKNIIIQQIYDKIKETGE